MKKYIYYTPIDLARAIIAIIPEIKIESIIDICCGSWKLIKNRTLFFHEFLHGK